MLDVRRLRLLRELHERGTVTAVAEALAYTPSAVSQQLATLEREAGVRLIERQGRRLRLTDAGRGLVEHAAAVIARLELAESELPPPLATRGRAGAARRVPDRRVGPVMPLLARAAASELRVELLEMEAEEGSSCCAAARSTSCWPRSTTTRRARATPGLVLRDVCRDPLVLVLPAGASAGRRAPGESRSPRSPARPGRRRARGTTFDDSMVRACRALGGFEPDLATARTTSPCSSSSSRRARRSRCCRRSAARAGCRASRSAARRGAARPQHLPRRPARERGRAALRRSRRCASRRGAAWGCLASTSTAALRGRGGRGPPVNAGEARA